MLGEEYELEYLPLFDEELWKFVASFMRQVTGNQDYENQDLRGLREMHCPLMGELCYNTCL